MEQNHKYFPLQGEVIYRSIPVQIPDKHYKSAYFTLKCKLTEYKNDGSRIEIDDYFSIHTYSEDQITRIREGFIIQCLVRRDSNLWIKDNEVQTRIKIRKDREGNEITMGKYQMIFENYNLIGKINILDDSVNKEIMNIENANFKGFLDETTPNE